MTFELSMLVATVGILFFLLVFQGGLVPINQGFGWGLGSRDAKRQPTRLQSRATRTVANHMESMALFVPLVLAAHVVGISAWQTVWGAGIYLAGRAAFAVFYLGGVPVLRSVAWGVSVAGILMVAGELVKALF